MSRTLGESQQGLDGDRERNRRRRSREGLHVRHALLPGLHDRRVHGNAAEERHVGLGRHALSAAAQEDVGGLAAVRADEAAHVLNDAQHRQIERDAEGQRLAHVVHGHALRRGDDHGAGVRAQQFDQRQGFVAGAGRSIYDEAVEVPPVHAGQHLADRRVLARSAPDDGIVILGKEELDRHRPEVFAHGRRSDPAGPPRLRLVIQPQQTGDAGPVKVDVEQADPASGVGQRGREVHRDRALADAALARKHEELVAHEKHAHLELVLLATRVVSHLAAAAAVTTVRRPAVRVAFTHRVPLLPGTA